MPTQQEPIDIIKQRLDEGLSKDEVRETLLGAGHSTEDVDAAFSSLQIPRKKEAENRILSISNVTNEGKFSFSSFLSLFFGRDNEKK